MEFRDRKLCTLDGVVFSSCAIQSSLRPSSTQRRIFDACGFRATLLVPTAPCSFYGSSLIGYMSLFLLPDARRMLPPRGNPLGAAASEYRRWQGRRALEGGLCYPWARQGTRAVAAKLAPITTRG